MKFAIMDLAALRIFRAVAEDGSVTRSRYIFKAGDTIWIGSDMLK